MTGLELGLLAFGAAVLGKGSRGTVTGYVAGQPVELELVDVGGGFGLRADAAAAFVRMRDSAAADGVALELDSTFRTYEEQAKLYADYQAGTGPLAAPPGWSNHQGGVATDIKTARGTNAAFQWLTSNARLFGFARTVPSEPWHWEYTA